MQTMNQSLADLIQRRLITFEDGLLRSADQDELRQIAVRSTGPADPDPLQQRGRNGTRADPGSRGPIEANSIISGLGSMIATFGAAYAGVFITPMVFSRDPSICR